jgi:hypothetical protein
MEYSKPVISTWMFSPKGRETPIDAASDIINALSNQVRDVEIIWNKVYKKSKTVRKWGVKKLLSIFITV